MNAESFTQYLQNPSLLHQISFQELKSLALQYPYCQNLHLLMLQKSLLDGNQDIEEHLHQAATYSTNRAHLFQLVKKAGTELPEVENFLLSEEYLELKSLSALEKEAIPLENPINGDASLQFQAGQVPPATDPGAVELDQLLSFPAGEEEDSLKEETEEAEASRAPQEAGKEPALMPVSEPLPTSIDGEAGPATDQEMEAVRPEPTPFTASEDIIGLATALPGLWPMPKAEELPTASNMPAPEKKEKTVRLSFAPPELDALKRQDQAKRKLRLAPGSAPLLENEGGIPPKPQPKTSFTTWVEQFQPPQIQVRLSEIMESKKMDEIKQKKKKKKGKGKKNISGFAALSITENEDIASETLAELLAAQGLYEKAIEMYQRLKLVFPEKSDFFAQKIENLKSE